ncbi:MAG: elongation factor G [bacterium]|nr:elongation factor G [Myxococcales bacterium]MCB9553785.1 elongation factor G [Myxococcales bacterium]
MITDLARVRNIGISAHIDSGKTTLTERILFYTNRIHAIHEVRGKDGVGAKMDSMELEKERGITIQSAATHCSWKDHHINIIDTPGHVDFTVEVERALRVLDGAILVLCGVAGVQSQSITVDRQMRRYNVPRLAFVNKCDRSGANPYRVTEQIRAKLGLNAVMVQIPIGLEDQHKGHVDLVKMRARYFSGPNGQDISETEIPADLRDRAEEYREILLDAISMFDDELMEAVLEGEVTEDMVNRAIRKATIDLELVPVFCGSAYKNVGVQSLLDGVLAYLPDPREVANFALDLSNNEEKVQLGYEPERPLVALAFKLEDGRYGQLTYVRVYQGTMRRGDTIYNVRTGKKTKVGRLVRMHSNEMEDIEETCGGDLVALFGIDCASGDTFTDDRINVAMTSMHVPEPVIQLMIKPVDNKSQINMSKALQRFTREDPTFRTYVDPESGETIISGMGELHLEVYIERMKREYKAEVETGAPQVAYRETISKLSEFNYTHKKQTGGSGQYGRVAGFMEPTEEGEFVFESQVVGGSIPKEYISSCEKGFRSMMGKGRLIGFPVVNVKFVVNDGAAHAVDSSDMAFQAAAHGAFKEGYDRAKPIILEPIMKVSVEGPSEFQGNIIGTLNQRRGMITNTTDQDSFCQIEADVPLSEMFGYSTVIRSATQGKAEFTMEFQKYAPVPTSIAEELKVKYAENRAR